jgi:general stress protein 26
MMADEKKVDELYELIDEVEIAMLTTRRSDGRLVSRPMATQDRHEGADLWFVTDIDTHKIHELEADPNVNVAYLDEDTMEWVSVSGTARISQDRERIHALYERSWKVWFPEGTGEAHDGGPDDPRLALILVDADTVVYMKQDRSAPAVLFEMAKGYATGEQPDVGTIRRLDGGELSG